MRKFLKQIQLRQRCDEMGCVAIACTCSESTNLGAAVYFTFLLTNSATFFSFWVSLISLSHPKIWKKKKKRNDKKGGIACEKGSLLWDFTDVAWYNNNKDTVDSTWATSSEI